MSSVTRRREMRRLAQLQQQRPTAACPLTWPPSFPGYGNARESSYSWLFCPLIHAAMAIVSGVPRPDSALDILRQNSPAGVIDAAVLCYAADFRQRNIDPSQPQYQHHHLDSNTQERLLHPGFKKSVAMKLKVSMASQTWTGSFLQSLPPGLRVCMRRLSEPMLQNSHRL